MNIPISDVRLNQSEHLLRCFRDANEYTVVDLEETKELQDFAGFWSDLVDTTEN